MFISKEDLEAAKAENARGYLLTPGEYEGVITSVEDKENSKGTGRYFHVVLKVHGKEMYDFINYDHENEVAQKIGVKRFVQLVEAAGFKPESFTAADHVQRVVGKSLTVNVGVETTEKWGDQNRIRFYKKGIQRSEPVAPKENTTFDMSDKDIPF